MIQPAQTDTSAAFDNDFRRLSPFGVTARALCSGSLFAPSPARDHIIRVIGSNLPPECGRYQGCTKAAPDLACAASHAKYTTRAHRCNLLRTAADYAWIG